MMTMTNSAALRRTKPIARVRLCAAMVLICGSLAGLSGCDSRSESDRILAQAGDVINAINIQGANPAPSIKRRGDELRAVIAKLKPLVDAKDPTTAGAGQLMLARAYGGLGELAAKAAADEERQFLNQINVVRAKLDQWVSQHAVAASLNVFDPTKDLAELDAQMAKRTEEVAKLTADLAKQEAEVAKIRAQAAAFKSEAQTVRQQETAVRARGENLSQTARADVIREAVEVSRRADGLERQAGETEALADKEAPVVVEIKNQIERVNRQKDSLQKAKQDIQERAAAARKQSAEATAEANKVGTEITTALTALNAKREAADGPTQEAIKQFTLAASTSKSSGTDAMRDARNAASASSAMFQQSLGDAHATRARSLTVHASVLNALATATPPLPGASDLSAKAKKAGDEAKAARESAITAYKAASAAYGGAGAKGEAKARFEELTKALEALEKEPVAIPAGAAKPSGDAAGDLAPEQAAEVETEVRAAIDAAMVDEAPLHAFIVPKGELAEKLMTANVAGIASKKTLDEAAKSKFGKSIKELIEASSDDAIKSNAMLKSMFDGEAAKQQFAMILPKSGKVSAKSASEATIAGMMGPMTLVKQDGRWTMQFELPVAMAPIVEPMAKASEKLKTELDGIVAKVNDGSLASGDDTLKALADALKAIMSGMMPGGGGQP